MGNADEYFPFDPGYGASANAARWRKMANLWAPDGVISGYLNQLNATITGTNQVTVQPGGMFIHGYYAEIVTAQVFTTTANGTIVAQVSFVNETVELYYKTNAVDYGPSATLNYEQSANNWEIPLWLLSSSALIDLRTMINPGMGLAWWSWYSGGASVTVTPSATNTAAASFLVARMPHAAPALLTGSAVITFNNLATAQTVTCQLVYQNGAADQYPTGSTPMAPVTAAVGGGGSAASLSMPVSLSMLVPATTQGRKTAGWIVSAGAGPAIQIAQISLSMSLVGSPSAN